MKVKGYGLYKTLIAIHERFILAIQEMEMKLRDAAETREDIQEHKEEHIEEKIQEYKEVPTVEKVDEHKEVPIEEKIQEHKEATTEEKVEEGKEKQKEEIGPVETELEIEEKTDEKPDAGNPEVVSEPPSVESQQDSLSYKSLLEKLNEAADRIRGQGSHGMEILVTEGLFGQTVQMEVSTERETPSKDNEPWQQSREVGFEQAHAGSTAKKERETYILTGREAYALLEEVAVKIANRTLAVDGFKVDIPLDENLAYTIKYEDSPLEGKLSITLSWIKSETIQ